jgi:Ca-activated chloride channel family protein
MGIEPQIAAKIATREDIKIYTIGIGANQVVVPTPFGNRVISPGSDLDEESLREIAKMTGGLFFRATDASQLNKVYRTIDELEPVNTDSETLRPIKELFYWPLAAAMLLMSLLIVSRWRRL